MRAMQKLGPELKKIQEKYADDKEMLRKETMKLYRQGGFNPIVGCLPMFVQMPIWIALWTSIQMSVELRHAAFLPIWLTDLAAPDALFTLPVSLWLIGNQLNLLPCPICLSSRTGLCLSWAWSLLHPCRDPGRLLRWLPFGLLFARYVCG